MRISNQQLPEISLVLFAVYCILLPAREVQTLSCRVFPLGYHNLFILPIESKPTFRGGGVAHISLVVSPRHFLRSQGTPARTELVNPRVGHPFALSDKLSYTSCISTPFVKRCLRLFYVLLTFFPTFESVITLFVTCSALTIHHCWFRYLSYFNFSYSVPAGWIIDAIHSFLHSINHFLLPLHSSNSYVSLFTKTLSIVVIVKIS